MAPAMTSPNQPHLVSLVLQSKKALQQGEQLCSRAHDISNASTQSAVDVFALDAKVKWISDAVIQQLKLAASVATSIHSRRSSLIKEVQEFDALRMQESNALDSTLELLGSQCVPSDFYRTDGDDDSSLFGPQYSDDSHRSPSSTVLITAPKPSKTLRDFIADRAIDEILDAIDNERNELDDVLEQTTDFPSVLRNTIDAIENALPNDAAPLDYADLERQEQTVSEMAGHLESLARHFDQMSSALHDTERGEEFDDEDIQEMNRDTDELPAIIADLEACFEVMSSLHDMFKSRKTSAETDAERLDSILDDLDELGGIMEEMLETQENVENTCTPLLASLHNHVSTLAALHGSFLEYQTAFKKLLVEIDRRRVYAEAAAKFVREMGKQLDAMVEGEHLVRQHFKAEHGHYLPENICVFANDPPTPWKIQATGDIEEVGKDFFH